MHTLTCDPSELTADVHVSSPLQSALELHVAAHASSPPIWTQEPLWQSLDDWHCEHVSPGSGPASTW
jgi:hypothetical protein